MMNDWQGWLYVAAVLIPLAAFVVELLFIRLLGRLNAYIATAAIATSFLLSAVGFVSYAASTGFQPAKGAHGSAGSDTIQEKGGTAEEQAKAGTKSERQPRAWTGRFEWVVIGAQGTALDPKTTSLSIPLEIYIDNLAVIMFCMVTFIATLIHVYSMGYMHDDPRYPLFFTYLSLFCFSMLGLVASGNVFMIFMCWELVGVCSYLLIGFWYEDKKNCDAANKAFITNRVGDIGMLVGLGIIWSSLGTFNIDEINRGLRDEHGKWHDVTTQGETSYQLVDRESGQAIKDAATGAPRQIPSWLLVIAGLGIFAGCVGKSAQFPLHVWLPDAMAGPTPVSALIHAATMVAAGVYLVGRFFPLFTPDVLLYIAYTGGITLFIAASIAMVQTDYKKVLAYSTVSQLGFMMLGLGVGGWAAGLFHLLTHAFFKALLFLGAGSVYHAVHTYEMPVLGGLRRKMPITAYTMLAATLAISGVPFFSGFYSKDAILSSAFAFAINSSSPIHWLLVLLPSVGATMTAFYMFRMWFLVFDGEPRGYPAPAVAEVQHGHGHGHDDHGGTHAPSHGHDHGHDGNPYDHAHESPPKMSWPLLILAVPTVCLGWSFSIFFLFGTPLVEHMLEYGEPIEANDLPAAHWYALGASLVIASAGIGAAIGFYSRWRIWDAKHAVERAGPVYDFLIHKWYFDELYDRTLVRPALGLARGIASFDRVVVDGIVNATAGITVFLSKFEGFFDQFAVDGLVNAVARVVYALGDWGRGLQTGKLRSYLTVLAFGVVILFIGVFFWIRQPV
jgi:proton-translocating NADH-quinone oxidoreductase chain L